MALRRYARTRVLGLNFRYGTSFAIPAIRDNIANGNIRFKETVLRENERLDILAGQEYGDGTLYWLIAAASGIGFVLQVPAGTRIVIPVLEDCVKYVS